MVSATEAIGDTSALCSSALKRTTHKIEMGASVACDGFVSSIAGIFGCTPITSFSQNVGLAAMSGVINRFTIATGAGIMILGGIFPVVGHLLTTIPQSVLGGCTIMMFGSIMYAGFRMMANCGFSDRNMIIASSLAEYRTWVYPGNWYVLYLPEDYPDCLRGKLCGSCIPFGGLAESHSAERS